MNEGLKRNIGKYISFEVNFMANGSQRKEYVQGKLIDVKEDILVVEQYIPFSSVFTKESEVHKLTREINIQKIVFGSMKGF